VSAPEPPASCESAALPVGVSVRTVVVRSGTASLPAVAFWTPIARASRMISTYRLSEPTWFPAVAATRIALVKRRSWMPVAARSWCRRRLPTRAANRPATMPPGRKQAMATGEPMTERPLAPPAEKPRKTTCPPRPPRQTGTLRGEAGAGAPLGAAGGGRAVRTHPDRSAGRGPERSRVRPGIPSPLRRRAAARHGRCSRAPSLAERSPPTPTSRSRSTPLGPPLSPPDSRTRPTQRPICPPVGGTVLAVTSLARTTPTTGSRVCMTG
jgi:hypothetical protein